MQLSEQAERDSGPWKAQEHVGSGIPGRCQAQSLIPCSLVQEWAEPYWDHKFYFPDWYGSQSHPQSSLLSGTLYSLLSA